MKMKLGAHQLKGASGYVGAGRVYYCCYHIQNGFNQDDIQKMVDYYPLLIESCIEFKRFSRAYLANRECKFSISLTAAIRHDFENNYPAR